MNVPYFGKLLVVRVNLNLRSYEENTVFKSIGFVFCGGVLAGRV